MSRHGRHLFTSESVTEGHPDKIADQISDSILDAILAQDPVGRVACETLVTTGLAVVAGEITTTASAMKGKASWMSVMRKRVLSIGPPQKPEHRPRAVPVSNEIPVPAIPTSKDIRPPWMSRLSTSRPT